MLAQATHRLAAAVVISALLAAAVPVAGAETAHLTRHVALPSISVQPADTPSPSNGYPWD